MSAVQMETAVATVPADLVAARARLLEMRQWIDDADDPTLLGAAVQSLYEFREWARIRKVATDLRAEAARLEAVALRKLGQMGRDSQRSSGLSNVWIATSNGFASMSDAEFEEMLAGADTYLSPHTLWNVVRKTREQVARHEAAHLFAKGDRSGPWRGVPNIEDIEPRGLAEAVRTILTAALADGDSFTIGEVTDSLLLWVDKNAGARELRENGSSLVDDPAFRSGMAEVVRKALDTESVSRIFSGAPRFVTYYDGDEAWTRIPWELATVDELNSMAVYRTHQAELLVEAAASLGKIARKLERVSQGADGERRIGVLEALLRGDEICPTCHLTKPCDCEAVA